MRNKILLLISLLLLSAALMSGCSSPTIAQPVLAQEENPTPRTLTVTGEGKVTITPDIAYISIGVHTEDKNAAEAVAANTTQAQKVVDALRAADIDPKDIQTINFSIYPQQQYDNEGKFQGINYVVDNTVYVTLRDIAKLGELLDTVVSAGANSINGIQFDVEDRSSALSKARKLAVEDAQKQANELASAAGVSLAQVISLNTYGVTPPVPVYDYRAGVGGAAAVEAAVPVSPGQMVVTVQVNMVYEIK